MVARINNVIRYCKICILGNGGELEEINAYEFLAISVVLFVVWL